MKIYCLCQITGDVPKRAHDSQGFGPTDNQYFMAPNRFGVVTNGPPGEETWKTYAVDAHGKTTRPVLLAQPMEIIQMGVPQEVLANGGKPPRNMWLKGMEPEDEAARRQEEKLFWNARQHFPNVDVLKCPNCGAIVVKE